MKRVARARTILVCVCHKEIVVNNCVEFSLAGDWARSGDRIGAENTTTVSAILLCIYAKIFKQRVDLHCSSKHDPITWRSEDHETRTAKKINRHAPKALLQKQGLVLCACVTRGKKTSSTPTTTLNSALERSRHDRA